MSGTNESNEELLRIDMIVRLPFKDSAGIYTSKFLATMRDEGRIVVNRCPKCGRFFLPPNIVCGWCKIEIEDNPGNWLEISDKGTVLTYFVVKEREVDRVTGKFIGVPNPNAQIRLDGGDENTCINHILEELDETKLRVGMRVQAVWKSKEERRGRISDILYFRTIEG
jgi:uncharacterized OB-fold protein